MMRIGVIGIVLFVAHILETTWVQEIRIGGVAPRFMVMIIVAFALLRGSKEGALIGFFAGLLYDLSFGLYFGEMILPYTLLGYLCGRLNKNFYRENFILPFVCTLGGSLMAHGSTLFILMMRGKLNWLYYFKRIIIPELIYTLTIALVIYQIMYLINEKIELKEKRTRNIF